jgi:hypothetical protein
MVLALSTQKGWKVYQMDVKSSFLNGYFWEAVYMTQNPSFELEG